MPEERYELGTVEANLLNRGIIKLHELINDATADYVQKAITILEASGSPPLLVVINSPGGELIPSMTIFDILSFYRGETTGLVIGQACSGGNLILQACNTRTAAPNSLLFVHNMGIDKHIDYNIATDSREWEKEWRKVKQYMRLWQAKLYLIYEQRTKKSRVEIRRIFRREEPLTSEQAKRLKIIDMIISADEVVQCNASGAMN